MDKLNSALIAEYLAGESNETNERKIKRWLESDPQNKKRMEEFRRIGEASEQQNKQLQDNFPPQEGWEQFRSRILRECELDGSSDVYFSSSNYSKSSATQFLKVAAIILFATFLGVLSYQHLYQQPEVAEPTLREISMDKGQRGNVTLSDGTEVKLNAESKIILPNVFQSDRREVTLEGEAYFDVTHNPERPFIINTDEAVVEVLGTSLNIRSYPSNESVQVVVKEGRVSLKSQGNCLNNDTVLNAGEMGQLFMSDNRIEKEKINDLELFLGWTSGFLKFKDAPLLTVARDLERKYNIEIRFDDQQLKGLKLTAELKSRTLQNNIDVISTSLGINHKIDQQVVTFYSDKK